jgi:hypothetical protein
MDGGAWETLRKTNLNKMNDTVPFFKLTMLIYRINAYYNCRNTRKLYQSLVWRLVPGFRGRYNDSLQTGRSGDRIPVGV